MTHLGIDFGTTTTEIAIRTGDALPVILPIGENQSKNYMPSVVLLTPGQNESGDNIRIGEDAETIPKSSFFIHSIKRCLGCHGERCAANRANGCHWCHGDGQVHLPDGTTLAPERIAFFILREALRRAMEIVRSRFGIDLTAEELLITPTIVGCGASFTLEQRSLILQAAREVGLQQLTLDFIVEEPILAGYAFSRFAAEPEGRVLIYDFGGGSFDVAILNVDDAKNVTVVATAGESYLGGDDIDAMILGDQIRQIAVQVSSSEDEVRALLTPTDYSMMRRFAKEAKESLSINTLYSNPLFSDSFGILNIELTRAHLEQLLTTPRADSKSLIDTSLDATLRACKLAFAFDVARDNDLLDTKKLIEHTLYEAAEHITRVVLVGGVTEIPLVRRRLAEIFGENKIESPEVIDPVESVAIGACYPRKLEDYSVAYPPYEFVLELRRSPNASPELIEIFDAYEYYRFHEAWYLNSIPMYRSQPVGLSQSYASARMGYRRAGVEGWNWQEIWLRGVGSYRFMVGLDGTVMMEYQNAAPIKIMRYPIIHPLQRAISVARDQRERELQDREIENALARGNTIFTEN